MVPSRRSITVVATTAAVAIVSLTASWLAVPATPRPVSTTPAKAALGTPLAAGPDTIPSGPRWQEVWGSAMAWGNGQIRDSTVRDLITVPTGGSELRIRFSNAFGRTPLKIATATIASPAPTAATAPTFATAPAASPATFANSTLHRITFAGAPDASIPPYSQAYSDPIYVPAAAGQSFAVSLYIPGVATVTEHPCCSAIRSFLLPGNHTDDPSVAGTPSPATRFVDALDALTTAPGSIVALGDSITDGFKSATRWTDQLQNRIDALDPDQRRPVIDEGITSNAVTASGRYRSGRPGGPPGVDRFARDVLSQSGVAEVVVLLGTNDIYAGALPTDVVAGYRRMIAAAHQAGVRIVAMTLLPRSSNRQQRWTATDQGRLDAVNRWIRTAGAFDSVIDTGRAVAAVYRGACRTADLYAPFDSGDHLHPGAAGDVAIADAIEPASLALPAMPRLTPLPPPTAGCRAAPQPSPAPTTPGPSRA